MVDAEKLLGKVLQTAMKSTTGKKKKKKKRKKSDDLMGSLVGGLTSGKGLVTAIGLGVGAYEIFKSKSGSHGSQGTWGGGAPTGAGGASQPAHSTPPPIPTQTTAQPGPPPPPVSENKQEQPKLMDSSQELATRLIQTMVAAAHSDGELDRVEEERILARLQEGGLTSEEKMFVLNQLHAPLSIEQLVDGVQEPSVAQTMYSLAVSAVIIDTPEERKWLDDLAEALAISKPMQKFIEEEM